MVIFRPRTFNRPMFSGTTGRRQGQKISDKHLQLEATPPGHMMPSAGELEVGGGLTGHLPQAADQQGLVVAAGKRDAVTPAVHQAVLEAMVSIQVGDTQQVLLQKF